VSHIVLTHNAVDHRQEFTRDLGHIRVTQIFNPSPKGFGANHNAAFKVCNEAFFAVLNPDLRFPIDPFALLKAELDNARVGVVAPTIVKADGSVEDSARSLYTPFSSAKGLSSEPRLQANNPAWLAGMFLLFRREAFTAVNGFDEKFFMYVEDVDICARLVLAGWALKYVNSVSVVHDARRANRKSLRHFLWHLTSAIRWWSSRTFWQYKKTLSSGR
jgi:N-acetylglucosaminyl-diphospho-decaprenol L-rhamnosyltransferase